MRRWIINNKIEEDAKLMISFFSRKIELDWNTYDYEKILCRYRKCDEQGSQEVG